MRPGDDHLLNMLFELSAESALQALVFSLEDEWARARAEVSTAQIEQWAATLGDDAWQVYTRVYQPSRVPHSMLIWFFEAERSRVINLGGLPRAEWPETLRDAGGFSREEARRAADQISATIRGLPFEQRIARLAALAGGWVLGCSVGSAHNLTAGSADVTAALDRATYRQIEYWLEPIFD